MFAAGLFLKVWVDKTFFETWASCNIWLVNFGPWRYQARSSCRSKTIFFPWKWLGQPSQNLFRKPGCWCCANLKWFFSSPFIMQCDVCWHVQGSMSHPWQAWNSTVCVMCAHTCTCAVELLQPPLSRSWNSAEHSLFVDFDPWLWTADQLQSLQG